MITVTPTAASKINELLTEENKAEDIVLDAGVCHRLSRPGLAIVHAPIGEADIIVA